MEVQQNVANNNRQNIDTTIHNINNNSSQNIAVQNPTQTYGYPYLQPYAHPYVQSAYGQKSHGGPSVSPIYEPVDSYPQQQGPIIIHER